MAGFRITPALWDKIHHFASFAQTGGASHSDHTCETHLSVRCSVVAADGALRPEPESGDSPESKPVPCGYVPSLRSFCSNHRSRGASGPVGPQGKGARRATPQSFSHALHQQGQELVCTFVRGQCFRVAFVFPTPFVKFRQELINFPPINLPPHIRNALMAPNVQAPTLPESIPNPAMSNRLDDFSITGNSTQTSSNKLRLRVPVEKRSITLYSLY